MQSTATPDPQSSGQALADPDGGRAAYLSSTITAIIASVTPMLALVYLCAVFLCFRYGQRHPRLLNKTSSLRLQRYGPAVYVFLVISSLSEVALSAWLLLQCRFNRNYPGIESRTGIRLILFSASWTVVTAGAYTLLFLHPTWSTHPVSSVGAQALWVLMTWALWVAGAAVLNTALPRLLVEASCDGLAYCGQIQALFAMSVVEILTLTGGMGIMLWLAWQSAHTLMYPMRST